MDYVEVMKHGVLILAVVDSVFFTVAAVGLCFGCMMKTVFVIQGCFCYCWAVLAQNQCLFCSSPHTTSELAGGQLGQLTPASTGVFPTCGIMLSIQSWRKKKITLLELQGWAKQANLPNEDAHCGIKGELQQTSLPFETILPFLIKEINDRAPHPWPVILVLPRAALKLQKHFARRSDLFV